MNITIYKHLSVFLLLSFILTACQSTPAPAITPVISTSIPTPTTTLDAATNTPVPTISAATVTGQLTPTATPLPTATAISQPSNSTSPFPSRPIPIDAYPRPPNDNGLGVHWSTHLYAQSDEATSYFVSELVRMNIKWVKLLSDGTSNRDYDHTIDELVTRDIMPVLRVYQQCNTPYDPEELDAMVRHYVDKGVYYYDLYNEPNQPGEPGGWCQPGGEPQPEYLAQVWADAARTIYLAGGYPGLPSFFAPDQKQPNWQDSFFYRFFRALRAQGNEDVLYFSWASIHNYNINHPPTYPFDEVNLTGRLLTDDEITRHNLSPEEIAEINLNRTVAGILRRRPLNADDAARLNLSRGEIEAINQKYENGELMGFTLYDDSTTFLHFIAFRNQFYDLFGFDIPMISTEGGATFGSGEDARYPVVDGQTVADWTLWSANYMLDDAPDFYFTTMTWLLAQRALDYDEPTWEKDAWYHDRDGDQEPVIDTLKNRPRLHEIRRVCDRDDAECQASKVAPQPNLNLLNNYPRPANDNGRGIHFSPTTLALHPKVVNYFVAELRAMNIKWVKFLQDDLPDVTNPYLIEQLVANDIEPVMRVYKPFNDPYEHLPNLIPQATEMGVHYFELYNEPNLAGPAGGWREGEAINIERIVDLWILAANDVHAAGGHPSLPPLAGGGTVDDMVFLREFLDGIRARGQADLLPGSWIAVHNYFLNHPLNYPADPVNMNDVPLTDEEIAEQGLTPEQVATINHARSIAKLSRDEGGFWVGNTINEDSNAFRKFEAYANIFYSRFGYHLPVISTEGGALVGSAEDPRYPPVQQEDLTELTLAAYHAMLDDVPPYFFAHTPWLLANSAGEHFDERFEQAAWYKNRTGNMLPVVEALKADPRKNEIRP
jgi:hypothetical protein